MSGTEPILAVLSRALDVAALRQSVHASNIANVDVDGYQRLEVAMGDPALAALDPALANDPTFQAAMVTTSADDAVRLDQEMAQMAQNALRYQALVGAVERSVGLLRAAIREGREG